MRLNRITDIVISPDNNFPYEFLEEVFAKKDEIRKKIKESCVRGRSQHTLLTSPSGPELQPSLGSERTPILL